MSTPPAPQPTSAASDRRGLAYHELDGRERWRVREEIEAAIIEYADVTVDADAIYVAGGMRATIRAHSSTRVESRRQRAAIGCADPRGPGMARPCGHLDEDALRPPQP